MSRIISQKCGYRLFYWYIWHCFFFIRITTKEDCTQIFCESLIICSCLGENTHSNELHSIRFVLSVVLYKFVKFIWVLWTIKRIMNLTVLKKIPTTKNCNKFQAKVYAQLFQIQLKPYLVHKSSMNSVKSHG